MLTRLGRGCHREAGTQPPEPEPAALRQTVRSSVMYVLGDSSPESPWIVMRPMCPVPVVTQICRPFETVFR